MQSYSVICLSCTKVTKGSAGLGQGLRNFATTFCYQIAFNLSSFDIISLYIYYDMCHLMCLSHRLAYAVFTAALASLATALSSIHINPLPITFFWSRPHLDKQLPSWSEQWWKNCLNIYQLTLLNNCQRLHADFLKIQHLILTPTVTSSCPQSVWLIDKWFK